MVASWMRIWRVVWMNALVACCFTVVISEAFAENRALLVGVGQYEMGLRLPGIDNDIRLMKKAVSLMGFEDRQVRVLLNEQATLDGIRVAVREWLVNGVTSQDCVLFYFSGHGSQIKDQDGDESDGADEVLLPYDAVLKGNNLEHVLVDEAFDRILNTIPADIVLVFLDACHSGTATRRVFNTADGYIPKFFDYKGMPEVIGKSDESAGETAGDHGKYIALSACRDDEEALSSKKGSLMTRGILSALDEAELLGTGLTMDAIKTSSTGFIAKSLGLSGRTQHPQMTGNIRLADIYIIDRHITNLRAGLEALAADPGYRFPIDAPDRLVINDPLVISCKPGKSGYLNVVVMDDHAREAMVLYPNRFHPDSHVNKDTVMTVPWKSALFSLRAQSPPGKSIILAFQTSEDINLFTNGVGDDTDYFKKLSAKSLEALSLVKKTHPSEFGAQTVVIEVTEK